VRPVHTMSLAATLCAIATNAGADELRPPAWYHINVHMHTQIRVPVQAALVWDSEETATQIFGKIGIQVTWRSGRDRRPSCGNSATRDLAIEIAPQAPENLSDGALAMAMPYGDSSVRIVIFYDRVALLLREHDAIQAKILGYVLAHEITHVLQGMARHSESGVMRSRWARDDYSQMGLGGLSFSAQDVRFIRFGVANFEVKAGCPEASSLRP
jgi:hypothetical protein